MEPLLFIYNPKAGQGKISGHLAEILDVFGYRGYLPSVYPTRAHGDATRVVRELGAQYRRIVCCGGDGTLHEVVAALMEMEEPPVLGYIPAGTTNDFSQNLRLPRDMALAAAVAVGEETAACDMGRFNGLPFVYVAAFGAFTEVSYGTPQRYKNALGHLAYILQGLGSLKDIRSHHLVVEHDGERLEGDYLFGMVSNTHSVGGFQGLPFQDIRLDDGEFEVLLIREGKSAIDYNSILASAWQGMPVEGGLVEAFHTSAVRFTCEEKLPWTLDGEFGGDHREARVRTIPQALTITARKNG